MNNHKDTKYTKGISTTTISNHKDTKYTKDISTTETTDRKETKPKERKDRADELSNVIIGAAIEVHRVLGPGLLESSYVQCLARELTLLNIPHRREVPLPLEYKGIKLDCGYRLDLLVDESVIVEIKAIQNLEAIHDAQLLTYLRLTGFWLDLLINFNVPVLKHGVKRLVNG